MTAQPATEGSGPCHRVPDLQRTREIHERLGLRGTAAAHRQDTDRWSWHGPYAPRATVRVVERLVDVPAIGQRLAHDGPGRLELASVHNETAYAPRPSVLLGAR